MRNHRTRVIRVVFELPPDPDRFHPKEKCRFAVVVLFPEEVKRQLGTATAAKAQAREIARQEIDARLYKPPIGGANVLALSAIRRCVSLIFIFELYFYR